MKKPFGIIYKAKNVITNMCYVGQTTRPLNTRKYQHINCKGKTYYFQKDIKKYGKDNFKWEIICECNSIEELNEKEVYYIKELNTLKPNGYNLTTGGLSYIKTDEHKRKISESNKGQIPWHKGKTNVYSKETLKRMSASALNRKLSIETKEKISKNNIGRKLTKQQIENRKKYSRTIIEQAIELRKNKVSWHDISMEINVPISTIRYWCKQGI